MDKKEKIVDIGKFFIPVILGLSVYVTIGMLMAESMRIKYWPLVAAYFFPPAGKESVIPAGIIAGFDPLLISLSIAFVDIIVALFLVWNYDLAKKIPIVGKFIIKIEKLGKNSSDKYGLIKHLEFIGIILFVMVPFQGSGGLVASIIGRMIGMKPLNTFIAISIGTIVGCSVIAFFSKSIVEIFLSNFETGVLIVIILICSGIIYYVLKRNKKKNRERYKY